MASWVGQAILGGMFTTIGAMKLFAPMEKLEDKFEWPKNVGSRGTRMIGAAELAGGIGTIVPAATRIAPWLTPMAALGLDLVMMSAAIYHVRRKELGALKMPLALGALAALVFLGRTKGAKIRCR